MGLEPNGIIQVSYAIIVFLFMVFFDFWLGRMLIEYAVGQSAEIGFLLGLMVTFVLAFGTFVVPLLIFRQIAVNPFNIMLE